MPPENDFVTVFVQMCTAWCKSIEICARLIEVAIQPAATFTQASTEIMQLREMSV
jgi:hypothetical protein